MRWLVAMLLALGLALPAWAQDRKPVRTGSKAFAESWILGEALALLGQQAGETTVEHSSNLGGTDIVYAALKRGDVDVYPEYTGTIAEAILKSPGRPTLAQMRAALAKEGLGISEPLGFNNGYALAVTRATAEERGLRAISDLAAQPDLRIALTHEFLERKDGWPGLAAHYGLRMRDVRGIQHDLAYEALGSGQIDVTDIYTTDAQIDRLGLVLLDDDRAFFPRYDAVLLYRLDLPDRAPRTWAAMTRLVGRIDEPTMIRANARVILEKQDQRQAAAALLQDVLGGQQAAVPLVRRDVLQEVLRDTQRHLWLVSLSLAAAVLVGVPLGILAADSRAVAGVTLSVTGVLQTLPSLALLAFLIPVLGIGEKPALAALFLYSLLPIVRNTYVGLTTIPPALAEAAEALGLSYGVQLRRIRLPMAAPSILAGIKTSAVINVGTATLGALIGAGGLGDPIWRGIQTVNTPLILQGAIPAALLALAVQGLFDLVERFTVSKGLRLTARSDA